MKRPATQFIQVYVLCVCFQIPTGKPRGEYFSLHKPKTCFQSIGTDRTGEMQAMGESSFLFLSKLFLALMKFLSLF